MRLETKNISKFSILAAPFKSLYGVFVGNEEHERNLGDFERETARMLCFFPDKQSSKQRFYKFRLGIGLTILTIFWATIAANTYNASRDIVSFGENTMFLLGVSLIYFKFLVFVFRCDEIDTIITALNELLFKTTELQNTQIEKLQRIFFLAEGSVYLFFHMMGLVLFLTLSIMPFLTRDTTPLPALFPFDLQDPNLHPFGARFVYVFQVIAILYGLLTLLSMDSLGLDCIIQTAFNLRILSLRLRMLGSDIRGKPIEFQQGLRELIITHQTIISLVEDINNALHFTFLMQMGLSTFMLGLASFEALLAKDDLMIAFKFVFFMCAATSQLFYWCLVGNLVYFESMDVAVAAYEVQKWYTQSPEVQRNLMLMIMRAQRPLMFRPKPFFPFTVETFTKIVKTSYTSFTLLCNTFE